MSYCDYITVYEPHSRHEPFFGTFADHYNDQGELLGRRYKPRNLEGLFHSSVGIHSDGNTVTFEGNPSRWNRPDAVVGLTVEDAKETVQQIMADNGLPTFTDKAIVTRCDMATNINCKSEYGLRQFMLYQSLQKFPRLGESEIGTTIYHGRGSKSRQIRIYEKGPELKAHARRRAKKQSPEVTAHHYELAKLFAYYARIETQYNDWLRCSGHREWKNLKHSTMEAHHMADVERLAEDFSAVDLSDLTPDEVKTLALWKMGLDTREFMHKNTWYKRRKRLKDTLGIDIALDCKAIEKLPEQVSVKIADLPVGYTAKVVALNGDVLKFEAA